MLLLQALQGKRESAYIHAIATAAGSVCCIQHFCGHLHVCGFLLSSSQMGFLGDQVLTGQCCRIGLNPRPYSDV